ncbi:MAG: dienelactone hydrolase family protein [Chloroflexi bacterium]|nr:dienelactone hydrolase family protein [Chloroflexota bacterium]
MCHPEVPAGTPLPDVRAQEITIKASDGGDMLGLLAFPQGTPAPAVLIVNDVFGRSDFYEHLARRIAQAGYVALDVEYFFREGPVPAGDREAAMARQPKLDQNRTLRDLEGALDQLRARPEVKGARLGVIGFCMGGTLALDLTATRTDIATVSYYGFPKGRPENPKAPPAPLEIAERMHGPLLGHWGTEDTGVGIENVRELDAKLTAAKVPHAFHEYEGFAHGFLKAFLDTEGSPGHEQACTSWKRTLDFWRKELGRAT